MGHRHGLVLRAAWRLLARKVWKTVVAVPQGSCPCERGDSFSARHGKTGGQTWAKYRDGLLN
jgi:hypothetical protein